tara:strand:+ start:1241 stop:1846 length:606 start_codon:yes stop_codon:yes gene_type:complete
MALIPPVIFSELQQARAASPFPFSGFQFDQLALGVSIAVSGWAIGQPQNVALTGVAAGAVGGGAVVPVTTKVFVVPNPPVMIAAFAGAGFVGPLGIALATVMAVGLGNAFSKNAQYAGPVAGVGVGQDVAKIVTANAATLIPLIVSTCTGTLGGGGPMLTQFATGLANGLSTMLLTGAGTGTVAGVPGPSPASGASTCVLV